MKKSPEASLEVKLHAIKVFNITGNSAELNWPVEIIPGKDGIPDNMEFYLLYSDPDHAPRDTADWHKYKMETPDTTHYRFQCTWNGLKPKTNYYVAALCKWGDNFIITYPTQFRTEQAIQAINLGLPSGLKWANENITDSRGNPTFFAWGEISEKTRYEWDTYKFGNYDDLSKYCTKSSDSHNGNFDSKTTLEWYDDAACYKFGKRWHIPTMTDWKELVVCCQWQWTKMNGQNGFKITGPNGNSIFLPADGQKDGTDRYQQGQNGFYWSSELDEESSRFAWCFCFDSSGARYSSYDSFLFGSYWRWDFTNTGRRCLGRTIRPVYR